MTVEIKVISFLFLLLILSCSTMIEMEELPTDLNLRIKRDSSLFNFQGKLINLTIEFNTTQKIDMDSLRLLVEYDPYTLEFRDVKAGRMIRKWEKLSFSEIESEVNYPKKLVLIEAWKNVKDKKDLAIDTIELNNNSNELLFLTFFAKTFDVCEFPFSDINFHMLGPGDNAIWHDGSDYPAIVKHVFTFNRFENRYEEDSLLANGLSIKELFRNRYVLHKFRNRGINAYNKTIRWTTLKTCLDPCDANINYIRHEIVDLMLFARYKVFGDSVFIVNYESQLAATDCLEDGHFGTLSDFVYLLRIINGNAIRKSDVKHYKHLVEIRNYGYSVVSETDYDLGAVLLVFEGNVDFAETLKDFTYLSGYVDGETRILIYDLDGSKIEAGRTNLVLLSSPAKLKSCEVAGYYGEMLVNEIVQ